MIAKTWDPGIGPTVIRYEMHEARQIFTGCFAFSLKELG
jgi:hypothetical protein